MGGVIQRDCDVCGLPGACLVCHDASGAAISGAFHVECWISAMAAGALERNLLRAQHGSAVSRRQPIFNAEEDK